MGTKAVWGGFRGNPLSMVSHVLIDPGHGGQDRGACYGGIEEAAWTLTFCRELVRVLNESHINMMASLSRTEDVTMSLEKRGSLATELHVDLVLSVHANAHELSSMRGALCFHWPTNWRTRRLGAALMRCLPPPLLRAGEESISVFTRLANEDGWLQRPRNVLGAYEQDAVLLEVGYLSNPIDRAGLTDPCTRLAIIHGIIAALAYWPLAVHPKGHVVPLESDET